MQQMSPQMKNGGHHRRAEPMLVCPRPRRAAPAVPEFLYPPLSCSHSHSGSQESTEILDMVSRKSNQGREPTVIGCSPSCYCGSPPARSGNPLVHDTQFVHQVQLFSNFSSVYDSS